MSRRSGTLPLFQLLARFSTRRRWQFLLVFLLTLVGAAAELLSIGAVVPFLQIVAAPDTLTRIPWVRDLLSSLGAGPAGSLIVPAATLLVGTAILSALVRIGLIWVTSRYVYGLTHDLSMMVYGRVIRQPYSTFIRRNSAVVLSGFEKVNILGGYLLNPLLTALSSFVIALGIVILLFLVDPIVASIAGGTVVLLYGGLGVLTRVTLLRLGRGLSLATTARTKLTQETLGGVRDIILDRSHDTFERQFRTVDAASRRMAAEVNFITLSPRYLVEGIGIVLIALLALYFTHRTGGVLGALPLLGALALGAQRLLPLAQAINLAWVQYASTSAFLTDILELLDAPVLSASPRSGGTVAPFREAVRLEGIGFAYGPDRSELTGIDLAIHKGARVGVIGQTGSGKTTLLDVFMGLLVPTEGRILVDGVPLDDASMENWQAQIAHVPQSIFLLDGSIADNIAFGTPGEHVDHARVEDAARRAGIADFVATLPDRYATEIGERGVRLSGGQRQRIGIARALYKRASVLVLDEATSALDDATERAVMQGIEDLDRDLTVLLIAHRLSTVAICDLVVRLDAGRIVQEGSYDEVVLGHERQHA